MKSNELENSTVSGLSNPTVQNPTVLMSTNHEISLSTSHDTSLKSNLIKEDSINKSDLGDVTFTTNNKKNNNNGIINIDESNNTNVDFNDNNDNNITKNNKIDNIISNHENNDNDIKDMKNNKNDDGNPNQNEILNETNDKVDPNHSLVRPIMSNRTLSGAYAPVRHPQMLAEASRGSSYSYSRRRDMNAQYQAQSRAYIKQLKDGTKNENYGEINMIMQGFDSDMDEDDLIGKEYAPSVGPEILRNDISTYPTISALNFSKSDIQNPRNRERLEWQAMLTSVLTGEVIRSEKNRITVKNNENSDLENELWLEIRAKIYGRTLQAQRKLVEEGRSQINSVLQGVLDFRIEATNIAPRDAEAEIDRVLRRVENCESLWRCSASMRADNAIYASPEFSARYEALIAWRTINDCINARLKILRRWTGSDDLDLNHIPGGDLSPESEAIIDKSPFVDRVLKETNLSNVFTAPVLISIPLLVRKADSTFKEYSKYFEEMNLPSFLEDLLTLISFPSRLILEIIRVRLLYAKKLANPTVIMIDQILSYFKQCISYSIAFKKEYIKYTSSIEMWNFPNYLEESFDKPVLECIKYYFELLSKKHIGMNKAKAFGSFKEAEVLENEWQFFKGIHKYIAESNIVVAEQFSDFLRKLLARLAVYTEKQMKGPPIITPNEMERWYMSTAENVRAVHRKLLRFYKILTNSYENCAEHSINRSQFKPLLDILSKTGHFLVYCGDALPSGVYIIADPSLATHPEDINKILRCSQQDDADSYGSGNNQKLTNLNVEEDEEIDSVDTSEDIEKIQPYILVICPEDNIFWNGMVVNVKIWWPIDAILPGRVRLMTFCPFNNLMNVQAHVSSIVGSINNVFVDQRTSLTKVNEEFNRIRKLFYKLSIFILDAPKKVQAQCKQIGCQDLVNHYFIFAGEFSQRVFRIFQFSDAKRRMSYILKIIQMSIDWVSFVCDDCIATDRKTFRWTVAALEFAMVMTRDINILAISEKEFYRLRLKVSNAMSLLISHFDIMGARSSMAAQLEKDKLENISSDAIDFNSVYDDDLIQFRREEMQKKLENIDNNRRLHLEEQHSVGRVLDDSKSETQFLMFLASSLSNVSIRWQQGQYIGGGTFGSVYLAINHDSGDIMAVKEIRMHDSHSFRQIVKSIKDEMTVLEMLSHPNIVQYLGIEVHRDKVYIFMEYCEGGSLATLLEHGRIEDETVIKVYTLQMLQGLAYLHSSGIVHRDVKPENILLDHMGVIKFVDFGAAKVIAKRGRSVSDSLVIKNNNVSSNNNGTDGSTEVDHNKSSGLGGNYSGVIKNTSMKSITGTPMYMSPEVITGSEMGRQGSNDIWSLGCCVLEMATGKRPWSNLDNEWAIMYHIATGHQPNIPSNDQLSPEGQAFLRRCFEPDPHSRPTALELLNDPWIMSLTWNNEPYKRSSSSSRSSSVPSS